jgi:hypothetical protein
VLGSNDKLAATLARSRINTAGSAITQNTQSGRRGRTAFGLSEIDESGISRRFGRALFRGIAATVKHKKQNSQNNIVISDGYSEGAAANLAAFAGAFG